MKTTLGLLLAITAYSAPALSCPPGTQAEAQMVGIISKLRPAPGGCVVQLGSLEYFNMSGVCPLFPVEMIDTDINLNPYQCEDLQIYDRISGVLVSSDGRLTLE